MVGVTVALAPHESETVLRGILEQAGATDITIRSRQNVQPGWEPDGEALAGWALLALLCGSLAGCSRDMQDQPSYHPQEAPRLHSPAGSVPRDSRAVISADRHNNVVGADSGEQLYRVNCLHCHGPRGEGNGPVAAYLKERPANLLSRAVQEKSQAELYDIVTNGKDMMPSFRGELSAAERQTVAALVQHLPKQVSHERGLINVK
jgi:mono/diheme cytochrome c family protein